jgi:hypothetical protein
MADIVSEDDRIPCRQCGTEGTTELTARVSELESQRDAARAALTEVTLQRDAALAELGSVRELERAARNVSSYR